MYSMAASSAPSLVAKIPMRVSPSYRTFIVSVYTLSIILPTSTGSLVLLAFLTGDLMGSTGELHIAKVVPTLGEVLVVLVHGIR